MSDEEKEIVKGMIADIEHMAGLMPGVLQPTRATLSTGLFLLKQKAKALLGDDE